MEKAQRRGHVHWIGVSNFSVSELEQVTAIATSRPAVNQVMFSPFEYRKALLAACLDLRITIEAYSPLGTGRHLSDPTVVEIAERVGRTPAQVLLRWCIQRQTVVISKSTHRERIEENGRLLTRARRAVIAVTSTPSMKPVGRTRPHETEMVVRTACAWQSRERTGRSRCDSRDCSSIAATMSSG